MKTLAVSLFVIAIIVIGMVIVANGVGVDLLGEATKAAATSECLNFLNKAGQVVSTTCR